MAIVSAGWQGTIDLIDGLGKVTQQTRRLRADDYTEAAAAISAYMDSLVAVTDCIVVGYSVGEIFTENALGALPAVTVLNSVQAVISAAILDQPTKFASTAIPGPKLTIFNGTSGKNAAIVDVNDPLVTAFLTEFTEAGSVYISDGESLDPVFNASGERVSKYRRLGKTN